MFKFLSIGVLALALGTSGAVRADERASADEAVAMVHKTIAQMKASSKEAVIADINAFSPQYRDRDLYVTVMDLTGKELAHGSNKKMQGVNLIDYKDQDGNLYMRTRIETAKAKGKGWQDYVFVNPVNKALEPKSMYFELYDNVVVSCGIYKKK